MQFEAVDGSGNVIPLTHDTSPSGATYSCPNVDMGQFDPGTYIRVIDVATGDGLDSTNNSTNPVPLEFIAKPQWLVSGSVNNVTQNGNKISFEGNYPIYNYPYTIPSTVKGIGGRSLDIAGNLIFNADFDISDGTTTVIDNRAQVQLNLLDQLPTYSNDIDLSTNCSLDADLNITLEITEELSTPSIDLNMPKIKFPVGGFATISVDAGLSLYAKLKGQIIVGEDQGSWGFIDNGTEKTKVIGVLTGEGVIRGEVSVLGGVGSADASLHATARLGIGFDYVSAPSTAINPLSGGDLNVWGRVCYKVFWGLGSGCQELPSFYYGYFGDTATFRSNDLYSFDEMFRSQSITFRNSGTTVLPDFNPQPTFATRAENLYATWLERDNNNGFLLMSKLNATGTEFSPEIIVANNSNSISNPKIGILPSGSAIITWSQSRYDINTIPSGASDNDKAQAQDVWFAIYDNDLDSIVFSDRLGDDSVSLQSGRAEGEAKISVGDNNDAMITWVAKDPSTNSSDIWFSHLTETTSSWDISPPTKLVDLSGTNYNVGIVYTDSVNALAVWINDTDGDEDTYDSDLMFAEWNGSNWSSAQLLSNNDGATKLKEVSLASNDGYISLAWTSTHFENDNDFENRIEMEVYDAVAGNWNDSSYFEDSDSMYYFQNPIASISNTGLASICYQVIKMYSDSNTVDNGELYLYAKDLNGNVDWKEITNNTALCDTNTFIWELTAGFSGNDRYYTMTQEYNDNGVVSSPYKGILFGNPDLSMVLRGLQLNSNLTVSDIAEPTVVPTGIREFQNKSNSRLLKNYPNPFNDITTIEFQLQKTANVRLEIFNFSGILVTTLLNTNLPTGIYSTIFKAGDLPNGIYFSKLTVDGDISTGKLILSK